MIARMNARNDLRMNARNDLRMNARNGSKQLKW
jgi:hypothetical protein